MNFSLTWTRSAIVEITAETTWCYIKRVMVAMIVVPCVVAGFLVGIMPSPAEGIFSFSGVAAEIAQFGIDHTTGNPNTARISYCPNIQSIKTPSSICNLVTKEISIDSWRNEIQRGLETIYLWGVGLGYVYAFFCMPASRLRLRHRSSSFFERKISALCSRYWPSADEK